MFRKKTRLLAAAALALLLVLVTFTGLFGGGEPEADPAAVDRHLDQIKEEQAAERANAIVAARAREEARERETEARAANYAGD
jgi:hypothetical protein